MYVRYTPNMIVYTLYMILELSVYACAENSNPYSIGVYGAQMLLCSPVHPFPCRFSVKKVQEN